jgi:hypothetical protein
MAILTALANNPRFALMRGTARFHPVRWGVARMRAALHSTAVARYERELEARMQTTLFPGVNRLAMLDELRARGCAFGLQLPPATVTAVREHAETHPVFAFRDEQCGFNPSDRARAEAALKKEILLAQYYNCETECGAIGAIAHDPLLNWIALKYLGSMPKLLGVNLWWTYPIRPSRADQVKHAHYYHRDVDDFRFLKFFFYLTDVDSGDGAHWLVAGSNHKPPYIRFKDRFLLRRYEDAEIEGFYDPAAITEVVGKAGLGFAEDTLCVHKAASPSIRPRLMLHVQFALFDFDNASDRRDPAQLRML